MESLAAVYSLRSVKLNPALEITHFAEKIFKRVGQ
jgi:hypothetical protein